MIFLFSRCGFVDWSVRSAEIVVLVSILAFEVRDLIGLCFQSIEIVEINFNTFYKTFTEIHFELYRLNGSVFYDIVFS